MLLRRDDTAVARQASVAAAAHAPEPDAFQGPRPGARVAADAAPAPGAGPAVLAAVVAGLGQHAGDDALALDDVPEALDEGGAALAELALAQAEQDAAEDLPGDAALGGEGGAAEDGELGDGVAGGEGVGGVVVQAQGRGQREGGGRGEEGAAEGEAEGGGGHGGRGAGGVVGGADGLGVVGVGGGRLEPGEGGGVVRGVGEVVRLQVLEEGRRRRVQVGHGALARRRGGKVDGRRDLRGRAEVLRRTGRGEVVDGRCRRRGL